MNTIDFDVLEEELGFEIPDIYKMFLDAVKSKGLDLGKFGIYNSTEEIVDGNTKLRLMLAENKPRWKESFFDFGVGDGCGNYFFIDSKGKNKTEIKLLAHDPPGIEKVGPATDFFMSLIGELEKDFEGPDAARFQGNLEGKSSKHIQ